jgi:hypothetical protein
LYFPSLWSWVTLWHVLGWRNMNRSDVCCFQVKTYKTQGAGHLCLSLWRGSYSGISIFLGLQMAPMLSKYRQSWQKMDKCQEQEIKCDPLQSLRFGVCLLPLDTGNRMEH